MTTTPSAVLSTKSTHFCHPLEQLDLLILEGPAGSGKSTVLGELLRRGSFHQPNPIVEFPRPRSYDGALNLALSIVKDGSSLLSAMIHQMLYPTKTPVVIDRFMISQMVYGRIRRGFDPGAPPWNRALMKDDVGELSMSVFLELFTELRFLRECYHLLISRDGHHGDRMNGITDALRQMQSPRLNLVFAILLPEITLLEGVRQEEFMKSQRRYPYIASQELYLYQYMADMLTQSIQSMQVANTYLTVRCFRYSNFDERDQLPVLIERRFETVLGRRRKSDGE